MEPIVLILLIVAPVLALVALARQGVIQIRSDGFLAGLAIISGFLGIVIALLCMMGNGSPVVMVGILISASVLFGCGMITLAILKKQG